MGITIGLYYNGARYLAAWLGRWTSADPIGIGADGPGLYNYTRGSPVNYTDPSGTDAVSELGKVVSGAGAALVGAVESSAQALGSAGAKRPSPGPGPSEPAYLVGEAFLSQLPALAGEKRVASLPGDLRAIAEDYQLKGADSRLVRDMASRVGDQKQDHQEKAIAAYQAFRRTIPPNQTMNIWGFEKKPDTYDQFYDEEINQKLVMEGHKLSTRPATLSGMLDNAAVPASELLLPEAAAGVAVILPRALRMNTGSKILPGELSVGTYDDLLAAGSRGDDITPHHIPSARHMAEHGVSHGDGISINVEHPSPGAGGRHRATATYGTNVDVKMPARDALAFGVRDAKRIYQQLGLYGPNVRMALQQVIGRNKTQYPGIFK